jgi:hypothetical protein
MGAQPWLISFEQLRSAHDREKLHRRAEAVVTRAYRNARCNAAVGAPEAFELAVRAYRRRYPYVPDALADRAAADILARHGLPHERSRSNRRNNG